MEVLDKHAEPWRVTLIDTGEETMIGESSYIGDDDAFCLTYGDGVADIDITESIAFHRREGRLATVTGEQPPGRFGAINHQGPRVTGFQESRAATATGSMAASSCFRPRSAITSKATPPYGKKNR